MKHISRYVVARGLMVFGYALLILGFILGGVIGGSWPLAVLMPAGLMVTAAFCVRCANCSKPVMRTYLGAQGRGYRPLAFRNRFLPERVCSDCGFDLS